MYKKMLVPLDGSPLAELALPYVRKMCTEFDLKATFLHVCQERESDSLFMCKSYIERISENTAKQLGRNEVDFEAVTQSGNVAQKILEQADKSASDLILMAAHGYSGPGLWRLGSIVHKVLTASRTPILVVRDEIAREHIESWPKNVILPLDGSALSEEALPHALAMAHTGAELTLLRVCEQPDLLADYPESDMPESWNEHVKLAVGGAERACGVYLNEVNQKKLTAELANVSTNVVLASSASEGIMEYAKKNPKALIVMSTHGKSGLSLWPYGHVADRVLMAASNPILLVRPRSAQSRAA